MSELATIERQSQALAQPANPFQAMIAAAASGGLTGESVGAMERLSDLYIKWEDRHAAKSYAEAKAALQADMDVIVATKIVPQRGSHLPYERMMEQVRPVLAKHKFSVGFEQEMTEKFTTAICHLSFGGHTETSRYSVRTVGGEVKGMSAAQASKTLTSAQEDSASFTTARRKALEAVLDIVIDHDPASANPRLMGDFINPAEAQELEDRLDALGKRPGVDQKKHAKFVENFLKFAQEAQVIPTKFTEIYTSALSRLRRTLEQAEAKVKLPSPPPSAAAPSNAPGSQNTTPDVASRIGEKPSPGTKPAPATGPGPETPTNTGASAHPLGGAPVPATVQAGAAESVHMANPTAESVNVNSAPPARSHEPSMGVKEAEAKPGKCKECGGVLTDGACHNCGNAEPTPAEAAAIALSESPMAVMTKFVKSLSPGQIEAAKAKAGYQGLVSKAPEATFRKFVFFAKLGG